MPFDFSGRSVLVTGGTSGIGLAIAQAFHKAGAAVVVAGLAGSSTPADCAGLQVQDLDVSDEAAVGAVFDRLQRLDVLVNAAGMIRRGEEHEMAMFERVVDVNLHGTMRASTAARISALISACSASDQPHQTVATSIAVDASETGAFGAGVDAEHRHASEASISFSMP